jgi:hypothetical protein
MVTVAIPIDRHPRHPHGIRAEAGEHPEANEGHRCQAEAGKGPRQGLADRHQDLQAIDPEHPWAKLLKEAVAAIRDAEFGRNPDE